MICTSVYLQKRSVNEYDLFADMLTMVTEREVVLAEASSQRWRGLSIYPGINDYATLQ